MYIKPLETNKHGFTLVEMMMSFGIGCLIIAGVMSGFIGCSTSLQALSTYASMSQSDQLAIDSMTREIRGLAGVSSYSATNYTNQAFQGSISITNILTCWPTGTTNTNDIINFVFDPTAQTLVRWQGSTNTMLLKNCQYLNFSFFQRNQSNGVFAPIPTTNASLAKIIQINWTCQRTTTATITNTECVNSAQIVMRCK